MQQYHQLLHHILDKGAIKDDRTWFVLVLAITFLKLLIPPQNTFR